MRDDKHPSAAAENDLEDMVASSDTGARKPLGVPGKLLVSIAAAWSLFQLWIASPLPYIVGFGVFSATEARSIHLAFALFLAFMAYPRLQTFAARSRAAGRLGSCGSGSLLRRLSVYFLCGFGPAAWVADYPGYRRGRRRHIDVVRSHAPRIGATLDDCGGGFLSPIHCLVLTCPAFLAHRGVSLGGLINHQWLGTQGVFGIALGGLHQLRVPVRVVRCTVG